MFRKSDGSLMTPELVVRNMFHALLCVSEIIKPKHWHNHIKICI